VQRDSRNLLWKRVPDGLLWCSVCYGMQENEDSLDDWAESLTELSTMKTDLSQYIIADDVLLLQEQVEHLHCQWEELCFKVSLLEHELTSFKFPRLPFSCLDIPFLPENSYFSYTLFCIVFRHSFIHPLLYYASIFIYIYFCWISFYWYLLTCSVCNVLFLLT